MTIQETLAAERSKYGERLTPAQAIALLNRVAWIHRAEGYGLLSKTSGNNWEGKACDILVLRPSARHFDVFVDGPDATQNYAGRCEPSWVDRGPIDISRFVAPVDPGGVEEPPPPPPPPPPPAQDPRVDELRAELNELRGRFESLVPHVGAHSTELAHVKNRLDQLENPPAREPRVVGTDRVWGHSHKVVIE